MSCDSRATGHLRHCRARAPLAHLVERRTFNPVGRVRVPHGAFFAWTSLLAVRTVVALELLLALATSRSLPTPIRLDILCFAKMRMCPDPRRVKTYSTRSRTAIAVC